MTAPALYGYTPDQWRRAARSAVEALRANPNDTEAIEQLQMARSVIREHAGQLGQRAQIAGRADTAEATRTSPLMSAALGASQGATFGLGEEAAALLQVPFAMFRWGEGFRQAYLRQRDQDRALLAQAQASHPAAYFAGEVAGGGVSGAGAAGAVGRALPALPGAVAAAARPGATALARVAGAGAAGAATAPIGFLFGYGAGEEGPVADVGGGVRAGVASGVLGGVLGGIGQSVVRRTSVRAADEAEKIARVRTEQARADMYEARAQQIGRQMGTPAAATGGDPAEQAFRAGLQRMGASPETVERSVALARSQGRFGGQAPIQTPTAVPARQAPSTQRVAEPGITSSEVDAAVREGRAGLAAQQALPVAEGPVAVPQVLQPRGATQGQLATRQGEIATRWLANAPTERAVVSIRALFANLPANEREQALRAFLGNYAAGRIHPAWVPIINQIRGLP